MSSASRWRPGARSIFDTVDGYRIARQDYELGEIHLEPDEAAAVALAARLWDSPELAEPAHSALVKLRAAGVEVDEEQGRVQPRVRATEPAFAPLLAAVRAGRAVTFDHRRGGAGGPVQRRTVEPWGVVSWRGRWYLFWHDRDRAAPRCFRVSRISEPVTPVGPAGAVQVPEGVDLMGMVRQSVDPPPVERHRPGLGRRRPRTRPAPARPGRRPAHPRRPGGRRDGARAAQPRDPRPLGGRPRPGRRRAGPARLAEAVRANWAASAAAHTEPLARTT